MNSIFTARGMIVSDDSSVEVVCYVKFSEKKVSTASCVSQDHQVAKELCGGNFRSSSDSKNFILSPIRVHYSIID